MMDLNYSKNINKDIGVENIHYLNDPLWKSSIET
jgi:predicted ribosome-associated RNA-binding protein Tma20